jgi:hypothetical protein
MHSITHVPARQLVHCCGHSPPGGCKSSSHASLPVASLPVALASLPVALASSAVESLPLALSVALPEVSALVVLPLIDAEPELDAEVPDVSLIEALPDSPLSDPVLASPPESPPHASANESVHHERRRVVRVRIATS